MLNKDEKRQNISASAIIKENVKLGSDITIEDNVFIDCNCIVRDHVHIRRNTVIGANCILGEYTGDFFETRDVGRHPLDIGGESFVRSGTILYGDSVIGDHFTTGHNVTIREQSKIGNHVSIGTLSDIQGYCTIGNYVRAHSNVHIGQKTTIEDFVWIFPYVIFTNDPTPPSDDLVGVYVEKFAIISTGSILLPGVTVHEDALVGAGAVVTKDVEQMAVVVGNPAKKVAEVGEIKNKVTGETVYPWRYTFARNMPWEGLGYDGWYHGDITPPPPPSDCVAYCICYSSSPPHFYIFKFVCFIRDVKRCSK